MLIPGHFHLDKPAFLTRENYDGVLYEEPEVDRLPMSLGDVTINASYKAKQCHEFSNLV